MIARHTLDLECPLCELKLIKADPVLSNWYRTKVKMNWKDAHISWAYRDEASQEEAFLDGKTKLHYPNSAHNQTPARALDLFQLSPDGKAVFDPGFYYAVNEMNEKEDTQIKWGGKFKTLGDLDHFELV